MSIGSADVADLRDPTAFRSFYEVALPAVHGYLFRATCGDQGRAEDLTAETFLSAVRHINQGDPAVSIPWLLVTARNKLIDEWRRRQRETKRLTLAYQRPPEPLSGDVSELTAEDAIDMLTALPESQRAALALRYIDDLPVPAVAAALGRSVHATESLLARGRQSLRKQIEEKERGS